MKENSLFDLLLEEPQKPSGPVTCRGGIRSGIRI